MPILCGLFDADIRKEAYSHAAFHCVGPSVGGDTWANPNLDLLKSDLTMTNFRMRHEGRPICNDSL